MFWLVGESAFAPDYLKSNEWICMKLSPDPEILYDNFYLKDYNYLSSL